MHIIEEKHIDRCASFERKIMAMLYEVRTPL
jgi:hypothetical protein